MVYRGTMLVYQFLERVINFSPPYFVFRSHRLKQINVGTKAEAMGEDLINFYNVVLNVHSKLGLESRTEEKCDVHNVLMR
jgi:hypothetical protein